MSSTFKRIEYMCTYCGKKKLVHQVWEDHSLVNVLEKMVINLIAG